MIATNLTIAEWSKYLQEKILNEHRCSNRSPNVAVLYAIFEPDAQQCWILATVHIAGDKDVEDGEAEYIGELISDSFIVINYCPFCGEKLS